MHIEIKQPKKPQKKLNIELNKKFELIKILLHCLYLADLCLLSFTDKNPKLIKKSKGSCNVLMKKCGCMYFPMVSFFKNPLHWNRHFSALYLLPVIIHTALHTYMFNTMYKLITGTSEYGLCILLNRLIIFFIS